MRLINASTIRLENFDNESVIPRYAILSHTWGEFEVTFQQFVNLPSLDSKERKRIFASAGYWKIVKSCKQALDDGLGYVWVDSCSIDKTSSAELSESINSMFKWYKRAEICYAYLDDVDLFDPMRTGDTRFAQENEGRFWTKSLDLLDEKDLAKARWFTRGWTLQELIAPWNVLFYIKGWKYVGNKTSMKSKLSRITGIDEATLGGRSLENVSIARRMSWASKRETTRTEDMAYCLLGIFSVNMPLLYGEGKRAFIRLQEEIMKDSDDQSLFAWSSNPSAKIEELSPDLETAADWQTCTIFDASLKIPGDEAIMKEWETHSLSNPSGWGIGLDPMSIGGSRSIFARHPDEFANSHRFFSTISHGQPYTLTNMGVRMNIPLILLEAERSVFLAVLECTDTPDAQLGIVVQRVAPDGHDHRFVRARMWGLVRVWGNVLQSAQMRTVYLCKKIPEMRSKNGEARRDMDVISMSSSLLASRMKGGEGVGAEMDGLSLHDVDSVANVLV